MTLHTAVLLVAAEQAEQEALFRLMRRLAGVPEDWPCHRENGRIWQTEPGPTNAVARVDARIGQAGWLVTWDTRLAGHDGRPADEIQKGLLTALRREMPAAWDPWLLYDLDLHGHWAQVAHFDADAS